MIHRNETAVRTREREEKNNRNFILAVHRASFAVNLSISSCNGANSLRSIKLNSCKIQNGYRHLILIIRQSTNLYEENEMFERRVQVGFLT